MAAKIVIAIHILSICKVCTEHFGLNPWKNINCNEGLHQHRVDVFFPSHGNPIYGWILRLKSQRKWRHSCQSSSDGTTWMRRGTHRVVRYLRFSHSVVLGCCLHTLSDPVGRTLQGPFSTLCVGKATASTVQVSLGQVITRKLEFFLLALHAP